MIIIALILILIPIALIIASIKTTGTLRKIFLSILTIIVLIPVTLILLIKPAQQGKILPNWGKISFLFAEPKDLWYYLAEATLEKNKKEYNFKFSHKYVGNYEINILFSNKNIDTMGMAKNDLELTASFQDNKRMLFSKKSTQVSWFIGLRGNGLNYINYSLPEDAPINKQIDVKIILLGNIEEFINKYGNSKITIGKDSDL